MFAPLRSDRVNAGVAWALVAAFLAVAAYRATTGEYLLTGFALAAAAVAVAPAAATRSPATMPPAEFVALLGLPTVVRAAFPGPVLAQVATYLSVATLALLVSVDLNALLDVEMSRGFAVAFVISTTMALAGLWTVVRFASDAYAGTGFLAGEDAVMWDLVVSTATGVGGGLLFAAYLHGAPAGGLRGVPESDGADGTDGADGEDGSGVDSDAGSAPDGAESGAEFSDRERLLARALQAVLLALAVYGTVTARYTVAVTGALTFCLTLVPGYLRKDYGVPLGPGVTAWITAAAVLHAVGYLGPYRTVGWYDQLTHTFSATVIAAGGYALVRAADVHSDSVDLPNEFAAAYVIVFVLALGVFWEVAEHFAEVVARAVGARSALVQYGLDDIVYDLTFNAAGAVVVAAWAELRGDEAEPVAAAISRRLLGRD